MWFLWIILYLLIGSLVLYGLKSWPRHWLQEIEDGKVKFSSELKSVPAIVLIIMMQGVFITYLLLWPASALVIIKDKHNGTPS